MAASDGHLGRDVDLEGGARGYLAAPASGSGPGVIVVHEAFGLVDHPRDVCDRLAREGFVALAPDLYRGASTTDPAEAQRLMTDLDVSRAGEDIAAAATTLLGHDAVTGAKVGCIGFCMGGHLALHGAAGCPRIGAVADCYGLHPGVVLDAAKISASVLGLFAENDSFVEADAVAGLERDLASAGVQAHFKTYLGVGHGFLNDSRPDVYDAATAREAWGDILSFLRAEL